MRPLCAYKAFSSFSIADSSTCKKLRRDLYHLKTNFTHQELEFNRPFTNLGASWLAARLLPLPYPFTRLLLTNQLAQSIDSARQATPNPAKFIASTTWRIHRFASRL